MGRRFVGQIKLGKNYTNLKKVKSGSNVLDKQVINNLIINSLGPTKFYFCQSADCLGLMGRAHRVAQWQIYLPAASQNLRTFTTEFEDPVS